MLDLIPFYLAPLHSGIHSAVHQWYRSDNCNGCILFLPIAIHNFCFLFFFSCLKTYWSALCNNKYTCLASDELAFTGQLTQLYLEHLKWIFPWKLFLYVIGNPWLVDYLVSATVVPVCLPLPGVSSSFVTHILALEQKYGIYHDI